jgi:thiol-disulfide isomerase/thioredoxin
MAEPRQGLQTTDRKANPMISAFVLSAAFSMGLSEPPQAPENVTHISLTAASGKSAIPLALPRHFVYDSRGMDLIAEKRLPAWIESSLGWTNHGVVLKTREGAISNPPPANLEGLFDAAAAAYGVSKPQLSFEKDEIVVVQYWADWCVPCLEEMKQFVDAAPGASTPVTWITIDLSGIEG